MSDKLTFKITETILNRIELEEQLKIKNKAIGYVILTMDGVEKRFWLMRFGGDASHRIIRDFVGNISIIEPTLNTELKVAGDNVFR